MDNICDLSLELISWLDKTPLPRVFFAGMTPLLRFSNPSSPNIEVCYLEKGSIEKLRIGDMEVDLPEHWACVHGLHFGNHSPPKKDRGRAWCVILDASGAPEKLAAKFRKSPVYAAAKATNPIELVDAFTRLRRVCVRQGLAPDGYNPAVAMFDPERADTTAGSIARVKSALLDVLGILSESSTGKEGNRSHFPESVERALCMIEERYADPKLTLESLTREACLSTDHFGRIFKTHMGMAPMAYVQKLRLREAALLLQRTEHRIEQISASIGYSNPLYFSRLFKKEFGQGPRSYRGHQVSSSPL